MKNKEVVKICAVCGDIAIAKNFGTLTCKSCKPFFRRNATKNKDFKCKNGDNCLITRNTRKKCQKCRLKKCFAVGMKKELILSDVEKHFRRSLVVENRKRKQKFIENQKKDSNREKETVVTSDTDSCISLNSIEVNDSSNVNQSIDENSVEMISNSSFCSEIIPYGKTVSNDYTIDTQISEMELFLGITEVIQRSSDAYKQTVDFVRERQPIPRPVNSFQNKFTELEDYKLMELFEVLKPIAQPSTKNNRIVEVTNVSELVLTGNIFYEREIKNLVNAIKKMNSFEDIEENDRIALVKYSCMDILCLRSILCFDTSEQSWILWLDREVACSTNLKLLRTLKKDIYDTYRTHLNDIVKECGSDIVIYDLLTAIALFNPNRPNLINRNIVKLQQHVYLYLLQRYLFFKYRSQSESEYRFVRLLNTLISARILGELEIKYFIQDYPELYCPLVKEIFDLHDSKSLMF